MDLINVAARVFYISLVFSNDHRVLSQCIIHGLGFLYLLSKMREYEYGMTSLFRIILGPHSMYSKIGIIVSQSSGLFGFIPLIFIPE